MNTRNKSCICGSGKKTKRCCGFVQYVPPPPLTSAERRLRQRDRQRALELIGLITAIAAV